jgi:hypothetical protein
VLVKGVLDLRRVDVLAPRDDHVFLAIDDVEETFFVGPPDVACV